jgi:hypothetical protein
MAVPRRLLIIALAAALALLAWLPFTQQAGVESARAGLQRALLTYASARAIDAVISVAQQTELTLQPGGVGPGFGVGQALEPLDDLIEQFSALMQWVLVAFGSQIMLSRLGAHGAVSLLLTLALGAIALLVWQRRAVPRALGRVALALLIVRFAVPLYAVGSEALHRHVLAQPYQAAQAALERSRDGIGPVRPAPAVPPPAPGADAPWYERVLPDWARKAELPRMPDVASIGQRVEQGIERLVDLAVLFLFETVALPLAFFAFVRLTWRAALGATSPTAATPSPTARDAAP